MGILSDLLGVGDAGADGSWLSGERDGSWRELAQFPNGLSIELNTESCFQSDGAHYFVLRVCDEDEDRIAYMGCFMLPGQDDGFLIIVDRQETQDGRVLESDDWSKNRGIKASIDPSIPRLMAAAKSFAAFNGYRSIPPYVARLDRAMRSY